MDHKVAGKNHVESDIHIGNTEASGARRATNVIQLQDVDLKLLRVLVSGGAVRRLFRRPGDPERQPVDHQRTNDDARNATRAQTLRAGAQRLSSDRTRRGDFRGGAAAASGGRKLLCGYRSAEETRLGEAVPRHHRQHGDRASASPLPQALQAFVSRGHDVHLDVYVGTPAELEERVLDGRLHIAVGHFPLHVPGLTYTDLYFEPDGLYCGKDHALAGRSPEHAALDEEIASSRVVARGYLQQHDLRMLKVSKAAATVDNIEAQAILILVGRLYRISADSLRGSLGCARGCMQICPSQFGSRLAVLRDHAAGRRTASHPAGLHDRPDGKLPYGPAGSTHGVRAGQRPLPYRA